MLKFFTESSFETQGKRQIHFRAKLSIANLGHQSRFHPAVKISAMNVKNLHGVTKCKVLRAKRGK